MPLSIRKLLAELMGKEQVSDEDLRKELDELKVDNKLDELTRDGHLAADPAVQDLARLAIKGQATPQQLEALIRAPRPVPAQSTTVTPPAGPEPGADPTEAAIRAEMTRSGTAYHEAAAAIAKGASLNGGVS